MTISEISAALAFTLSIVLSPIVRVYLLQKSLAPITWLSTIVLITSTWRTIEFFAWGFIAIAIVAVLLTNFIHTRAHRNGWNHMLFQSGYLLVGTAVALIVISYLN